MADDFIKRSDVRDALYSAIIEWNKDCGIARMEYLRIRLNNVPAADVRPVVRGRWLEGYKRQLCSICCYKGMRSWRFCPQCGAMMGADMREVDK